MLLFRVYKNKKLFLLWKEAVALVVAPLVLTGGSVEIVACPAFADEAELEKNS